MFARFNIQFARLVLLCAGGAALGCSEPPPPADAVARFEGGWVTGIEVERQMGLAPKRLPEDQNPREWVVRRIAWRKLLVEKWRHQIEASRSWQFLQHGAECHFLAGRMIGSLDSSIEVPDEAVEAEIERQRQLARGRQVSLRVRHIFLRADASMNESERMEQRALAGRILARLRQGESFEELARQYSQSETAQRGGLLDGLHRGVVDEAFERVAFGLEKGDLSDVVATPRGYHIIRLEERFTPPPFDADTIRPLVISQLRYRALQQRRAELLAELRATSSYVAAWNEAGELSPDEDGVVLQVGDVVLTTDDAESMFASASPTEGTARKRVETLDQLLDTELLCREAARRGVVPEDELSVERQRLVADLFQRTAERHELHSLQTSVKDEELERFAAEFPRRVAVPGEVRVQVVAFAYHDARAYEVFVGAQDLVAAARRGGDLSELARVFAETFEVELAEDTALMPPQQLAEYGPEVAQAVSALQPGEVTDVVRLAANRFVLLTGAHDGALVVTRLLERRPERSLDLETEGDELRRRYWKRFASAMIAQQQERELTEAGFELLGPL